MIRKKILGVLMSCLLALSTSAVKPENSEKAFREVTLLSGEEVEFDSRGTVDLSIANEERLISMLKRSGKIAENASAEEEIQGLRRYLKDMEKDYSRDPSKLLKEEKITLGRIKQEVKNNGLPKHNNKYPSTPSRTWDGKVKNDKILVLLQEFSNYKHGSISPDETDMFYNDYTVKHYEDMIFGENGYVGPNGENLLSMKQYYKEQSGGSYNIEGKVLGWYSATGTAAYYGADSPTSHNIRAKTFVYEALIAAAKDSGVNLADYDQEDPYDIDGDGDFDEPDGIIDHLMVIHAGVGQEAGGGILGEDAIWSHSSRLASGPVAVPGATSNSPNFGGRLAAWAYTIMPEDGASGVFAHEFGHDLGLPDEYDTVYSGKGEPVGYWSLMASGSWAGKIPGTEPTGFSPYGKLYLQETYGGNWMHGTTINIKDIPKSGFKYVLDQAAIKGSNNDFVKVILPDKENEINKPYSGKYEYFGGIGKDGSPIKTSMVTNIDLTNKTSAQLLFKTWYDIEESWDFASIQVREKGTDKWTAIKGNITTTERNPQAAVIVQNGITGTSNGWIDGVFDLSNYINKIIELKFEYETDLYSFGQGFYIDDINVIADNKTILWDNAEEQSNFTLNGFVKATGKIYTPHYYLLEWRTHVGSDSGLAHIARAKSLMSYDEGLVIWYADEFYTDNWVGIHPGEGFLGVVDADQTLNYWNYLNGSTPNQVASTGFQIHDAAFSQKKSQPMLIDYSELYGRILSDNNTKTNHVFDDSYSYINPIIPDAGRNIPTYGLNISVTGEKNNGSEATIMIKVK